MFRIELKLALFFFCALCSSAIFKTLALMRFHFGYLLSAQRREKKHECPPPLIINSEPPTRGRKERDGCDWLTPVHLNIIPFLYSQASRGRNLKSQLHLLSNRLSDSLLYTRCTHVRTASLSDWLGTTDEPSCLPPPPQRDRCL